MMNVLFDNFCWNDIYFLNFTWLVIWKNPCLMIVQGSNSQLNIHLYDSSSECDKLEDFSTITWVVLNFCILFRKVTICEMSLWFSTYLCCLYAFQPKTMTSKCICPLLWSRIPYSDLSDPRSVNTSLNGMCGFLYFQFWRGTKFSQISITTFILCCWYDKL